MSFQASGVRLPYISVGGEARPGFGFLRRPSGRLSLGRISLVLAFAIVVLPLVVAAWYFTLVASPLYFSESRFAVRSTVEAPATDDDLGSGGSEAGKISGGSAGSALGTLGGAGGAGSSTVQDPFVVASFLMSSQLTERLDQDGWLRALFSRPEIDRWSRLEAETSHEELFAYWRRHVTAAVDRRANTIQLNVRAYSAQDARDIATRALAIAEEMITSLTERQRTDTLALARAELALAEARYESVGARLLQMRRETRIVDPASEATAAGTTLLRLLRERIKARTERETLRNLGGVRAPGLVEIEATLKGLDGQIAEANDRLTGRSATGSVLQSVMNIEALELERRFAEAALNIATSVFDRARREAEHRASFLLVYLRPTLPIQPHEPNLPVSLAFVAALSGISWLFVMTAISITLDQID